MHVAGAIRHVFAIESLEAYLKDAKVHVFTHWGGGTRDSIKSNEEHFNNVVHGDTSTSFFKRWRFISLSSERPEIIDLSSRVLQIPLGEELTQFIANLDNKIQIEFLEALLLACKCKNEGARNTVIRRIRSRYKKNISEYALGFKQIKDVVLNSTAPIESIQKCSHELEKLIFNGGKTS